jgi:hypothetical protein
MSDDRESLTFTRWLAFIMLVAISILAIKRFHSESITLEFIIRGTTALSLAACFLLLSFRRKISGTVFGVLTLLSLPAVDVVHYFRHKSSLTDALSPCVGAFLGLGFLFYVLLRNRKRNDSDVA